MLRPGATLGILGGGQLGRMLTFEAHKLGLRTAVLDPARDGPAGQVADRVFEGAFTDAKAALELARASDVVTVETEHIPFEILEAIEREGKVVLPSSAVLRVVQDRARQKAFLEERGFPQPAFRPVRDAASLERAVAELGAPLVLKSLTGGYDGKGQARLRSADEAQAAWASLGRAPCIAERFVDFDAEVSVVLARGRAGEVTFYPLARNEHRRGILHLTLAPAGAPRAVEARARAIAQGIAEALGHVGVMAVEMFLLKDGSLLVNEIAPRVHNSGHFTLDACVTSQFEQHVRAVAGMPLGDPSLLAPAAMLNVLGEAWAKGEPDWGVVHREPRAKLHLYGKAKASPGRKMAHVTVVGADLDSARASAQRIHDAIAGG